MKGEIAIFPGKWQCNIAKEFANTNDITFYILNFPQKGAPPQFKRLCHLHIEILQTIVLC